ncbi:hypothetical protein KCU69_g74, partial [Aureobasidium melanogenum]
MTRCIERYLPLFSLTTYRLFKASSSSEACRISLSLPPYPPRDTHCSVKYPSLSQVYVVVFAIVAHGVCDESGTTKLYGWHHEGATQRCLSIRVPARHLIHLFSDLKKPRHTFTSGAPFLQKHSTMIPPGELVFSKRSHSNAVHPVERGDKELCLLDVHLMVGVGAQGISSQVDGIGISSMNCKMRSERSGSLVALIQRSVSEGLAQPLLESCHPLQNCSWDNDVFWENCQVTDVGSKHLAGTTEACFANPPLVSDRFFWNVGISGIEGCRLLIGRRRREVEGA